MLEPYAYNPEEPTVFAVRAEVRAVDLGGEIGACFKGSIAGLATERAGRVGAKNAAQRKRRMLSM